MGEGPQNRSQRGIAANGEEDNLGGDLGVVSSKNLKKRQTPGTRINSKPQNTNRPHQHTSVSARFVLLGIGLGVRVGLGVVAASLGLALMPLLLATTTCNVNVNHDERETG